MMVLLTGATGFLGSYIAEELINQNFKVIALKQKTSDIWRCESFKNKIHWIDYDNLNEILNYDIDSFIHTAWVGTSVIDRQNWIMQEKNIGFLIEILEIVKKTKIRKIIALGSQAEYGQFEGIVNEKYLCNPTTPYGVFKICVSSIIKIFAEENNIDWYWIRLFSIFGPREQEDRLIPIIIKNLLDKKPIEFSPGEQQYDYLYVKDFAKGILNIVKSDKNSSGIFNFSSGKSIKIKEILLALENRISPVENFLQIGKESYRKDQIMHMQGDSTQFFKLFNFNPQYNIYNGLDETIEYYLNIKGK